MGVISSVSSLEQRHTFHSWRTLGPKQLNSSKMIPCSAVKMMNRIFRVSMVTGPVTSGSVSARPTPQPRAKRIDEIIAVTKGRVMLLDNGIDKDSLSSALLWQQMQRMVRNRLQMSR